MKLMVLILLVFLADIFPQWENKHGNLPQWYPRGYSIDALNSNTAFIAVDPSGFPTPEVLYKTTNGGNTWEGLLGQQPFSVADISIVDEDNIWICTFYPNHILMTSDGGITWQQQYEAPDSLTACFNYIKMFDYNNGIAMGDSPIPFTGKPVLFLKTTNGGNNWIPQSNLFVNSFSFNLWRLVDFISPETGFFVPSNEDSTERNIFRTTDGANSWVQVTSGFKPLIHCIKFYDQNYGFMFKWKCDPACQGYLFRTTNAGATWDSTLFSSDDQMGLDFEFLPNDPSKIWLVTTKGLHFSADSGRTWNQETALQFQNGQDIVITEDKTGWLLTESVYRNLKADQLTSVNEISDVISSYQLYQNYPNPFNPATTFTFSLPQQEFVTLIIYDILGRELTTVVNEILNAGEHNYNFDAAGLSSGVYFYKLTAGEYTSSKKMQVIK